MRTMIQLSLSLVVLACSSPSADLALRADAPDESRFEELRRRQNLRVILPDGTTLIHEPVSIWQFVDGDLRLHCASSVVEFCQGTPQGCALSHCDAQIDLCQAHALMEITGVLDQPLELRDADGDLISSVPTQTTATNALLAWVASTQALDAIERASNELRSAAGLPQSGGVCGVSDLTQDALGQSVGRSFSMVFVEAVELAKEATQAAVRWNLDLADAHYSEQPSDASAARLAMSAPLQSRAYAAHLLIGGEEGLMDPSTTPPTASTENSWCTSAPITPAERAAVQILREAAVNPSDLVELGETPLHDLLVSNGDSVMRRLEELWGQPMAYTDVGELAAAFGLTRGDFVAARRRMAEEHHAFGRSDSEHLPVRALAGGGESSFARFVATGTSPQPAPWPYYAAMARYVATPDSADPAIPNDEYAAKGLAHLLDYAVTEASYLVSQDILSGSLQSDVLDPLAAFVADGARERLARLRLWSGAPLADLYHPEDWDRDDLVLVTSVDGLRCATEGHIEGQPCEWADVNALSYDGHFPESETTGFGTVTYWDTDPGWGRFHILRRRAGRAADTPGSYENLVGAWSNPAEDTNIPVVPSLARQAAEIILPSPEWCTHPQVTCSGADFDERIPLENELIEDGDAFESSWRHYLSLARQAANEADALGEEVITRGLEMDVRAEAALEELEQVCGTSLDLDGFLDASLTGVRGVQCPLGTECGSEERCVLGQCIRDAVQVMETQHDASPEMARAHECLSQDATVDFATLGSKPLCVWTKVANENEICGYPASFTDEDKLDMPCPYFPNETGACAEAPSALYGAVEVNEQLGYFGEEGEHGRFGGAPPCDAIRRLRSESNPSPGLDRGEILRSGFFDPPRIRQIARRIGWQAHFGNTSTLRYDGRPWVTTGNIGIDPSSLVDWPCDLPPIERECASTGSGHGEGLFCSRVESASRCADVLARAEFNDRLARAAIATRLLTGNDLTGVRLPYYPPETGLSITDYSEETYVAAGLPLRRGAEPHTYYTYPRSSQTSFACVDCSSGCNVGDDVAWTRIDRFPGGETSFDLISRCEGDLPQYFAVFDYGRGPGHRASDAPEHETFAGRIWNGLGPRRLDPEHDGVGSWFARMLRSDDRFRDEADAGIPIQDFFGYDVDCGRTPGCDNRAFIGRRNGEDRFSISNGEALDAMELVCEAGRLSSAQCAMSLPPQVNTVDDLPAARDYLACVANEIERRASIAILTNLPSRAIDALRKDSAIGSYPAVGGEYGAQLSRLRASLVDLAGAGPLLAAELRHLSNDVDRLRTVLAREDLRTEMGEIQFMSTVSAQMAACAASVLSPLGAPEGTGSIWPSIATCANSLAQINFAGQLRDLGAEDSALAGDQAMIDFRDQFTTRSTTLQGLGTRITASIEGIDSALAQLEVLRTRGRRLLAKATFADTDAAGTHFNVNTVMRRRHNTARIRYERARQDAIHMAHLAKRAIEQRLGMRLGEMRDDMALVSAPSTWEASLCTLDGIDYARIRDATALESDNFTNGYIGDYVTKLENVVESYRLDYPFQNSEDTAVLSLRDEVLNVRAPCDVEVDNLLYHAGQPDVLVDVLAGSPGWERLGCAESGGEGLPHCVMARRVEGGEGDDTTPFDEAEALPHPELSAASGYRVTFGQLGEGCDGTDCGLVPETMLAQRLDLAPGRYRLSYYAGSVGGNGPPLSEVVAVLDDGDPSTSLTAPADAIDFDAMEHWNRYFHIFDVDSAMTVRVAILPAQTSPDMQGQQVDIAAIMLEDVSGVVEGGSYDPFGHLPPAFVNTSDTRTRRVAACEDTAGEHFRSRFRRGCIRLCAEGYGRGCDTEVADTHCYHETELSITQRDIERGRMIRSAGFARGNFNYRVDTLALNFVGTSTRRCADERLPSTCRSSGNIPYSITHLGPYTVRNHRGEDYEAPLFTGRIEHARGLAAERYITNPISTADRALVDPYMRRELRGRPLDGTYLIRVWDEPGVSFEGIEDVQVVLNYRYWTRFE